MRRRPKLPRDVTGSNIGLSFLDVLASALGAAVLLFVILASTPVHPVTRARASGTFIRYEWTVDNPSALFRAYLFPPSGGMITVDPYLTKGAAVVDCQNGVDSILAMGFSPDSREEDEKLQRTYVLRLTGLAPGKWKAIFVYYDSVQTGTWDFPKLSVSPLWMAVNDGSVVATHSDPANAVYSRGLPFDRGAKPPDADFNAELVAPEVDVVGVRGDACPKSKVAP